MLMPLLAAAIVAGPAGRCCMTDPAGWYLDPPEKIEKRFALYKDAGVDTLRVEFDWRGLESPDGRWSTERIGPYLDLVRRFGFRVKLIVGALMAPPKWFLDAHPDARITDQTGRTSTNTVSYWYPGLHALMDDKVGRMRALLQETGLADRVDYVIPALGPAGEAVYPVPWTLGVDVPQTMWCYDEHAQRDFAVRMRRKYRTVAAANAAWGTDFASWDAVRVLPPGARPGPYWNDVLAWYRDTKRAFVRWQSAALKRVFPKAAVLIYIPGTAYSDADWAEAVRTGAGNDRILMMADSFFLIDLAARTGAMLQYTGCENEPEVARLRRYIDEKGYRRLAVWGENAGVLGAARDPLHLAHVVTAYGLCGLDYTHAHFAFEQDGVTPNAVWPLLKEAYARIRGER